MIFQTPSIIDRPELAALLDSIIEKSVFEERETIPDHFNDSLIRFFKKESKLAHKLATKLVEKHGAGMLNVECWRDERASANMIRVTLTTFRKI